MQIHELLIEYLITGSVALIWIIPLMSLLNLIPSKEYAPFFLLFTPGLYVVGMIIDFLSGRLLKRLRNRIGNEFNEKLKTLGKEPDSFSFYEQEVKFMMYYPELSKSARIQTSRHRIVRSTIVNLIFAMVIVTFYNILNKSSILIIVLPIVVGLLLIPLCIVAWKRYRRISYYTVFYALKILESRKE